MMFRWKCSEWGMDPSAWKKSARFSRACVAGKKYCEAIILQTVFVVKKVLIILGLSVVSAK